MSTQSEISVGCVVMAAGNGRRFGENKLFAPFEGVTLLERALRAVPAERFVEVCVVTQYDAAEVLAAEYGFRCVRNDRPVLGISHTVRLGTEALQNRCGAILYLVSDQPLLRRESVGALLDFALSHPGKIVAASHAGKRGNPCLFPARFFAELCTLSGDTGGSAVIRVHPEALLLFELSARELADADTPQALAALEAM